MSDIVNKLWGFCHTLRHDGIDYGDYIEQLTYLLFLKMADERGIDLSDAQWVNDRGEQAVMDCSWPTLLEKSGSRLLDHFTDILCVLSRQAGLLGSIFVQSQPRFNNPVNLKRVITLIDEEDWSSLDIDVALCNLEWFVRGLCSPEPYHSMSASREHL